MTDASFAASTFDREPPFSVEAEVSVLGAMLLDNEAISVVLERLSAGMFYRIANRRLFQAMVRIWERGEVCDPITLTDQLKATHELDASGGIEYIAALIDAVPTAANVEYHAKIVREKSQLRKLIEAATTTIRDAYDQGERSVDEVIGEAETRVMALGESKGRDYVRVKERLWDVFAELEDIQKKKAENPAELPGIPTGLHDLDRKILGLHPGQLTVVAARPSMGKTSLATGWALNATINHNTPTIIFSFEMGVNELLTRAMASEGKLDLQRLRGGERLAQHEHQQLAAAAGHLNPAPLYIDDSSDVGLASVMGRIRRAVKQDEIRLVIIDYLQLMSGVGSNRREEIDSITRAMKAMTRALNLPIVLVSQLSRGPENRTDKRPLMSDLRESGGIEQDADNIIMLYRPEYYMNPQQLAQLNGKEGLTELLIQKQRNGPTGRVKVHFEKKSTRFDSLVRPGVGPQPD